ncbi:MAG TPA: T9SS type A sorting domain-containing protein, partial [Saprospiraceae bacterium]|nr:T9SS type A sorting domain-containing protein [Saprospiraceae bacterium]
LDLVMVRMGNAASDSGVSVPIVLDREIWQYLGKIVGFSPSSTIYENISNDHLVINTLISNNILLLNSNISIFNGSIFDTKGRKVREFQESAINISELERGLYIVLVRLKNGRIKTEKFVKL